METGARARGLAGWARGRALGDGVFGGWVAAANVPSAYTQMTHVSRTTNHQSLLTNHAFLIATRPELEIELTHSQQTRKLFLIATFSAISAPAPHLANHDPRIGPPFLFDTNKPHKIIILTRTPLKTKEKRFSIRYKFALGSIGLPAAVGNLVNRPALRQENLVFAIHGDRAFRIWLY
jgi:hypothetical protein